MPTRQHAEGAYDMARKPTKAKKARKKPAGSRKKRMSKPGKKTRKAAAKPARKTKAKTTAKSARKPAHVRQNMRRRDPDMAVNALIMMVLIMIALASGYLYLHNQPGGAAMAQPAAIAMEKK
jgi:hypothetical protein